MSNETLFLIANNSVIPVWLLLALAPRSLWTARLVHSGAVFVLLGVAYGLLLWADSPGPANANFSSLEGVTQIFTSPKTIIAAWIHYLAFDLFVGAWIVRDAQRHQLRHLYVLPSLVLTLMLGPLGLLSWLGLRWALLKRHHPIAYWDL